jgi:hypothetical protein
MAGYSLSSVDWSKFQTMIMKPSQRQLTTLAQLALKARAIFRSYFAKNDPVLRWPEELKALTQIVAARLSQPDWYSDISDAGKSVWERTIHDACGHRSAGIGMRLEHDGFYWDAIDFLRGQFGIPVNGYDPKRALSDFGTRPFRFPSEFFKKRRKFGDWCPHHSMHSPEEVQRLLKELQSLAVAVKNSRDAAVQEQYEDDLMPTIKRVAEEGTALLVWVDT